MSKYFGNGVTATLDGDSLGQLKALSLPNDNYETEDFTGLGDTHEDMRMVPMQSAEEFDLTFSYDRSETIQGTIEGLVGNNTGVNLVVTFPWASNNTYTQSVVVKSLGQTEVAPKDELIRTVTLLTKAAGAWSTV